MKEIFRLTRDGRPLAVLGDESALRTCLPELPDRELRSIGRFLHGARLLGKHVIAQPPAFPIEVRNEVWFCRRDSTEWWSRRDARR